ncbi:MAG: fibronectin type III domain-containing protein [Acidobacteriota bacterium]
MSIRVLSGMMLAAMVARGQVYVSPQGNDAAKGTATTPVQSLDRAVTLARHYSSHTVLLSAGSYRLSHPLTFSAADSGLTLRASSHQATTISGGIRLIGWHMETASRNLWSAVLPPDVTMPRQIYINGVRANRASGRLPVHLTMNAEGYTASDNTMAHWRHPEALEFVYNGGNGIWSEPSVGLGSWTQPRCLVAAIHGDTIIMTEPCWKNSTQRIFLPSGLRSANLVGPASVGKEPSLVENAYELLGRPGEFYADPATHVIYYTPRQGEDLRSADVEVPVLEHLIEMRGTLAEPIRDISINGITFAYARWNEPSTQEGFSEIQANYRVTGNDGATKQALCTLVPGGTCPYASWTPEPGNVIAEYTKGVRFSRDVFQHLGAAGLSIVRGAQGDVVEGCIFTDISGNGLELGNIDRPEATDADFPVRNRIENNLFRNVGAEFRGGIPIVVGYARFTHIAHNQIDHIPYAAISIGWGGWPDKIDLPGVANRSTGNVIEKNFIAHLMLMLSDGGGIYTQGRTGNSLADGEVVASNVIQDQFSSGHAIYTDNGSAMITVRGNVMYHANFDNWGSRHKDYYDGAHGSENDPLAIEDNWWEQGDPDSSAKQVIERGNHLITSLSQAPDAILHDAGLEQPYRDLLNVPRPRTAPESPISVSGFRTSSEAFVTWRPPVFEGSSPVTSYTVHSSDGTSATLSAEDFERYSYARLAVQAGAPSLTFSVLANNAAGSSAYSVPSSPVAASLSSPPLPSAPQSASAHVEGTRASIHFGAPSEHGEGVIAYLIRVDDGSRSETVTGRKEIALEGRHVTFISLDQLAPGKAHRFGVAAVTPWGTGAFVWVDARVDGPSGEP